MPAITLASLDAGYLSDDSRLVRRLIEQLAAIAVKGNTITVNEFYDQVKNNGAAQQVLLQMAIKDIFEEKYGKDEIGRAHV